MDSFEAIMDESIKLDVSSVATYQSIVNLLHKAFNAGINHGTQRAKEEVENALHMIEIQFRK